MGLNKYIVTSEYREVDQTLRQVGEIIYTTPERGLKLVKSGKCRLEQEYIAKAVDTRYNKDGNLEFYSTLTGDVISVVNEVGIDDVEAMKTNIILDDYTPGVDDLASTLTRIIAENEGNIRILLPKGTHIVTTVFSGSYERVRLEFADGAMIQVAGGTFDLSGMYIKAEPEQQIFSGTVTGTMSNNNVYLNWFGVTSDNYTALKTAASVAEEKACIHLQEDYTVIGNMALDPTLTQDTDENGIVDTWSRDLPSGITPVFSIDGGQKIEIVANDNSTNKTNISKLFFVSPGDEILINVDTKREAVVGTINSRVVVSAQNSTGTQIGNYLIQSNVAPDHYTTQKYKITIPAGATQIRLILANFPVTAGATGSVWFKNLYVIKKLSIDHAKLSFDYGAKLILPVETLEPYLNLDCEIAGGLIQLFDGKVGGSPKAPEFFPQWYGAIGDGINADGELITEMINTFADNTNIFTLTIPDNFTFLGDITISKSKVQIKGKGTIKGTVKYDYDVKTYTNNAIEGVTIDCVDRSKPCISFKNCYTWKASNVDYKNSSKSLLIEDIGERHSGRFIIDHCRFYNNDYELYINNDVSGYEYFQLVDVQFTNNQIYDSRITGIFGRGVDGLLIGANTFFVAGYQAQSAIKERNIDLFNINFCIITENNLFEAGLESILIGKYMNTQICHNNIAWPGQRLLSAAIRMYGTSKLDDTRLINSKIHGNNIDSPTMYGIKLDSYVYGLSVTDNDILFDASNSRYYGDEVFSVSDRRAIKTDSTVEEYVLFANNNYPNSTCDIYINNKLNGVRVLGDRSTGGRVVNLGEARTEITDSFAASSMDMADDTFSKYDMLIITPARTLDLLIKNLGTGVENKEITMLNLSAANITFSEVDEMRLKSETTFAVNTMRKFKHYNGLWYEV